ncbi:MAG: hypothetical protein ABIO03_45390 [Umezawaea sp.]
MVAGLLAEHWNTVDVDMLASGVDAGGRALQSNAWMALRRLGWTVAPPPDVTVNDRIVRLAQEQVGRVLRSATWRAGLTAGVLATWPADPTKRTPQEWDSVRKAIAGWQFLPSGVIRSRTRQITAFARTHGRLPVDVFELKPAPGVARMLLLSACDRQQATIERADDPSRVLLRRGTGRGLPPAHPRHPTTMGRSTTGHHVRHRITKLIRDAVLSTGGRGCVIV